MRIVNLALLCVLGFPTSGLAADQKAISTTFEQTSSSLESAQSYNFISSINGESYKISVYVPRSIPPRDGFPTLYVLDGGNLFGTFANAITTESKAKEIEPAIVVGIDGGPGENSADRSFDFSPSQLSDYEKTVIVDLGKNPKLGGYENFLRVIREEIKPKIATLGSVNPSRDMIFGWSLGGQFVIHTMLTHPDAFSTYLAVSPSLWYADKAAFKAIPGFEQGVASTNQKVSLWIGAGSLEQERSPGMTRWPVDQKKLAEEITYVNMVGNALDFSTLMRPFFNERGLRFSSHVLDQETHNTAPWAAVNPVLRFALPGGQDE